MSTQPETFLTPEEYLEIERRAEFKSEYYNGLMSAMPRDNPQHARIISNLVRAFDPRRLPMYSGLRLKASPSGLYTYPDLMVISGEHRFDDAQNDTLLNPRLVVEVMSEATLDYDRGEKFQCYRGMTSVLEYLIVEQPAPHVELWTRLHENHWLLRESNDLSQSLHVTSIDCVLRLSDVYDRVDWAA